MGAIANGGKAAVPRLIEKSSTSFGLPTGIYFAHKSGKLIEADTASTIADMMHNNVIETYGQDRFPGMDICAKSGTAEIGPDQSPNAWFTRLSAGRGHALCLHRAGRARRRRLVGRGHDRLAGADGGGRAGVLKFRLKNRSRLIPAGICFFYLYGLSALR